MLNSLRIRLTLLFVSLTVIPLIIVGTLIARQGSDSLQKQSIELQELRASQISASLGAFFEERQNELTTLTEVSGLASLDTDTQRNVLLALLSKQTAYYQLTLANADGQETVKLTRGAAVKSSDLTNRATDPLFQTTTETGRISFSPIYFDEAARDRLITIAIPIQNLFTGETGMVLLAEVRFQNVEGEVLRGLDIAEGEDVYVVDINGVVIAHRDPNLVIKETVFNLPETEGRHVGLNGDDVILAMDTIQLQNQSLVVVAETTYSNATALAYELTQLSAIITVAALLIAGFVAVWIVLWVARPITKIAQVAETIQSGDLSARADETGSNEIAMLGRAFNGMTAQLQQTLVGLQDNVTKLEESNKQRERLIKDLQAAKRLAEENSRLKSEFLSTMSHELRTPMNAIEGFTGIMLKRMGGVEYNEKVEKYLNKVQSNSRRLLNLINDFLDLSRIESGRLELAYLPISPVNMVKKWENELGSLANGKDIRFKVVVDPNLPETIYGDEEALSKIATNLLGNAFKFTSEGEVTLCMERREDQVAIQVTDTGIGIPPHAREFIFDEFRQIDQSSKRLYGGTGLGLAIVQKLVRTMGGKVTLESEVGKGSSFTVVIPIQTDKELVQG